MHCLQHGLVQAISLHCKLKDGQDGFLTHVRCDSALVNFPQEVHWVVLDVNASPSIDPLFFVQQMLH